MSATVCPINPPGHDWQAGLTCRWCQATRTPGEAILSGLASVRGWSPDAARTVRDAYRAEVLAADDEAYDGELAMLRGLVATIRAVVGNDSSAEKQAAEVRQLLAEHAGDEAHARLLAMDTTPEFFQPGHAYTHRDGSDFRCVAVTTHPGTGEPRALGWIVRNGWHDAGALDPDDWTHAYDGCEPPTSTQGDSK